MMKVIEELVLLGAAVNACDPYPTIMYLQDASTSFNGVRSILVEDMPKVLADLKTKYGHAYMGAASFTDKPIPYRGWGNRNAKPVSDLCYVLEFPISEDETQLSAALAEMSMMSGGDFPENPYEAVIGAITDTSAGWGSTEQTASAGPAYIVVFATDDLPHRQGDAKAGIDLFNRPRIPSVASDDYVGGFGHKKAITVDSGLIYPGTQNNTDEAYFELCDLYAKKDQGTELTSEEQERFDILEWSLGPTGQWEAVTAHEGTYEEVINCDKHEYPSLTVLSEALNRSAASIVALLKAPKVVGFETAQICKASGFIDESIPDDSVTSEQILDCMVKTYKQDFATMSPYAIIVEGFESAEDILVGVEAALEVTNPVCTAFGQGP